MIFLRFVGYFVLIGIFTNSDSLAFVGALLAVLITERKN